MTVDELLADPVAAAELPAGAIPLHAIVLIEYANPGSANVPDRPRLSQTSDDTCSAWGSIGMLGFALGRELAAETAVDEDE